MNCANTQPCIMKKRIPDLKKVLQRFYCDCNSGQILPKPFEYFPFFIVIYVSEISNLSMHSSSISNSTRKKVVADLLTCYVTGKKSPSYGETCYVTGKKSSSYGETTVKQAWLDNLLPRLIFNLF